MGEGWDEGGRGVMCYVVIMGKCAAADFFSLIALVLLLL